MKDFQRVFDPTADQQWLYRSRRQHDLPASDAGAILSFIGGAMLGAVIVLLVVA